MFRTDLLEQVGFHTPRAVTRIPTQDIHPVGIDELIAEFLRLNRRFRIPLCPQEWCGFSESDNTGMFSCRGPCGNLDDVAKYFHKSKWIGHLMHHKVGDRLCNIQLNVSFLPNGSIDIQALSLQS